MNFPQIQGIRYQQRHDEVGQSLDVIHIDNTFCNAEIAFQGAQILRYDVKQHAQSYPVLWCSEKNTFSPSKAIRGGIPLCFPWFGANESDKNLPAHGFARNQLWQLEEITFKAEHGHVLRFGLADNASTRLLWDAAFHLQMEIHCGATLKLVLQVSNTDQKVLDFSFAWHSYFAIDDIEQIYITGLEDTDYLDQLSSDRILLQEQTPIRFSQELDRVYAKTKGQCTIQDSTAQDSQHIHITTEHCQSVVVWNPWQSKAERLGDLATHAWRKFVCVENGNVASARQQIHPHQTCAYVLSIQFNNSSRA